MATNFKKDPAVIEHVNNEVGKASVKAAKAETTRILNIVKAHAADNKANTEDKAIRNAIASVYKDLTAAIKNTEEATGGA